MKKILTWLFIFTLSFTLFTNDVNAKTQVTLIKCVDGDTITVMLNKKQETVRFLAIDTPETKHPNIGVEPFGKEASEFTCDKVTKAKILELEFDPNSTERDNYNRVLAWIWVDNELLQSKLINEGLAKVDYLYGDYIHTKNLQKLESLAKEKQIGIWGDYVEEINWFYIILFILAIIAVLLIPSRRKILKKKTKKELEKRINKNIDRLFK